MSAAQGNSNQIYLKLLLKQRQQKVAMANIFEAWDDANPNLAPQPPGAWTRFEIDGSWHGLSLPTQGFKIPEAT